MSVLLRHPGMVPALFSREIEDRVRTPFDPWRKLSRHLKPLSVRASGEVRHGQLIAAMTTGLAGVPLAKTASFLLVLAIMR